MHLTGEPLEGKPLEVKSAEGEHLEGTSAEEESFEGEHLETGELFEEAAFGWVLDPSLVDYDFAL